SLFIISVLPFIKYPIKTITRNIPMKIIAQLTYIPLSENDPREKVHEILEHLAQYDVEIEVGYLSTTIIGAPKVVFEVIRDLYDTMSLETERFRFQIDLLSPTKE
ncbi:MAG: hypothetical protein WD022_11260, partial [Balneolaceae bacterium]